MKNSSKSGSYAHHAYLLTMQCQNFFLSSFQLSFIFWISFLSFVYWVPASFKVLDRIITHTFSYIFCLFFISHLDFIFIYWMPPMFPYPVLFSRIKYIAVAFIFKNSFSHRTKTIPLPQIRFHDTWTCFACTIQLRILMPVLNSRNYRGFVTKLQYLINQVFPPFHVYLF